MTIHPAVLSLRESQHAVCQHINKHSDAAHLHPCEGAEFSHPPHGFTHHQAECQIDHFFGPILLIGSLIFVPLPCRLLKWFLFFLCFNVVNVSVYPSIHLRPIGVALGERQSTLWTDLLPRLWPCLHQARVHCKL